MKNLLKSLVKVIVVSSICIFLFGSFTDAKAASTVSVGEIDYEQLTMKVYKNGNNIVYFSTDNKKTWNEIEGNAVTDAIGQYLLMDISWASAASSSKIMFKGNSATTVISVTLPKQSSDFKVKFDPVNTGFEFSGQDSETYFYWRKTTDYNWQQVPFDTSTPQYKAFIDQVESLRFKGSKIVFRIGQKKGTSEDNPGERPGKEVTVGIAKLASAPSIKVNVQKLNLNTKSTLEYFDPINSKWIACEKNMTVADIAPSTLYGNGGHTVTLKIRTAATEKKAASLITTITIPGQKAAPSVGSLASSSEVKCGAKDGKLVLEFTKASAKLQYEYCIVKPDKEFELYKTSWRTVKNNKVIKVSKGSAPEGSVIYIRYKGVSENVSKGISLELPSDYTYRNISY